MEYLMSVLEILNNELSSCEVLNTHIMYILYTELMSNWNIVESGWTY